VNLVAWQELERVFGLEPHGGAQLACLSVALRCEGPAPVFVFLPGVPRNRNHGRSHR